MFTLAFPSLAVLNVMQLSSPASAILSAIIFNALVIVALIPLALRGGEVPCGVGLEHPEPQPADLRALGGIIAPFVGIKLIDLLISLIPGLS